MPRCPTHCPPKDSGPLLPAAIIAGVFVIAATWTVIVHVLTILMITLGVIAGLGVVGLAAVITMRLRSIAREPQAPRTIRAAADQLQITTSRAPAAGCQQGHESGHRLAPATEQHWHLHLHGVGEAQLGHVLGQPPGRMTGAWEWSQAPADGGGLHNA
jgi:hypothetical protein